MKTYKKIIIYYFTGTGNARNVATWVSDVAVARNMECQIVNISQISSFPVDHPPVGALVFFISPIHGFNYPPNMVDFIFHFPKGDNDVILMNTRAGMKIGQFVTPGLTGVAFYLAALVLKMKGYFINGMYPVDMPSNWISIHPGLNEKTVLFLHQKMKLRVDRYAGKVLGGTKSYVALREIVQDILIGPIAFMYYFIGRFFLAKTYYASRDCNNCDICIKNCPVRAIIKVDQRPFWTFKCESCMRCMSHCPKKAIETGHGYTIVFSLFFYLILTGIFYKYFGLYFFEINNSLLKMVVESVLFLSLMAIWYRIVHWAIRFKAIERLIVYTSLTKFKFWGRRYKALYQGANQNSSDDN